MYKILLCCKSGLTTNMLVNEMKKEAKKRNINTLIWAMAESIISLSWSDADCVLVAPQNASEVGEIKGIVNNTIPVDVIDSDDFVKMNGQAVLDQAINLINK